MSKRCDDERLLNLKTDWPTHFLDGLYKHCLVRRGMCSYCTRTRTRTIFLVLWPTCSLDSGANLRSLIKLEVEDETPNFDINNWQWWAEDRSFDFCFNQDSMGLPDLFRIISYSVHLVASCIGDGT